MKEEEIMKEITFSFFPTISVFPFREVLGLSLKILFHKNKEIKRMLSKKMAFSLMGLITLLAFAFAFVADDAFAAEKPFEITIAGRAAVTVALEDDSSTSDVTENVVTVDLIIESAHAIGDLTIEAR